MLVTYPGLRQAKAEIISSCGFTECFGTEVPRADISVMKTRPIRFLGAHASEFLNHFSYDYSQHLITEGWRHCRLLNCTYYYEPHPIWEQIGRLSNGLVFVLGGGLPMYLTMMDMYGKQPVTFFEYHRQNDANDLVRSPHSKFEKSYYWEDQTLQSVSVVDKVYSGGSLELAANRIQELHPHLKVNRVGLFPKTLLGVLSCDTIAFAGQLLDVAPLRSTLSPDDWHITLWKTATQ